MENTFKDLYKEHKFHKEALKECSTCYKDADYYLSQCSSANETRRINTKYGYKSIHSVEDKKVILEFHQYADGEDDFSEELVNVEVQDKSLLDNLKEALLLQPNELLGN